MKKITLLAVLIFTVLASQAQSVAGYSFSESPETYTEVIGINSTAMGDDGTDNNNPIGFIFNFGGIEFSSFSISTNGFIRLGNDVAGNNWINSLASDAAQRPLIAAFWDDHNRNAGSIQYSVSGVAPLRTLEIGWNDISISNGGVASATGIGSFKMRLHETTGQIDFVYGPQISSAGNITASIGLNGASDFLSVTPSLPVATSSIATANNTINSGAGVIGRKFTFLPSPQCSGAPSPGNTLTSIEAVCDDVTFALSLENQPEVFGLSYQWQISSNGTDFSDIENATGSELSLVQDASSYYRCIVTCSGESTPSTPVFVATNAPALCFCYPNYDIGKTDGDLISNVVIGGTSLSNNTGTEPVNPFYNYFTGQPNYTATLQAGAVYPISVTVGTYAQQNVSVWIDYNDDIAFTEDERVGFTTTSIGSNGTGTFQIQLSCDPPAGMHRMRIRDVWSVTGADIDPCDTYGYGETEDYDIMILAGESCPMPYGLALTSANSTSAQLVWMSGCGQTSWDVYVTETGGGLENAPSHTNVTSPLVVGSLSPSTTYDFYVMGYCGEEGNSSWAGPFSFTTSVMAVENDECESAIPLITGGTFDENSLQATNVGATKTIGPANPTCASFGFGGDVWFSVIVPEDGNITIETRPEEGSPLIDTGLNVFTGECGALTVLGCSDDEGVDAFSVLNLTGLTPGSVIYARVWEYANDMLGTFRVSAWNTSLSKPDFANSQFEIYPNPVKNKLSISHVEAISDVEIYSLLGQRVFVSKPNVLNAEIDMSAMPTGVYIVKAKAGSDSGSFRVVRD